MAGYPPQHFAAPHQPGPHAVPYNGPPYGMHPGPPVHHGYGPPMPPPGAGPYQHPFPPPGGPSGGGPWGDPAFDHHAPPPPPSGMHGPPPPSQSGPPSMGRPNYGGGMPGGPPGPPPPNGPQSGHGPPHNMPHGGQHPPYGAMPPHEYQALPPPPPQSSGRPRPGPSQVMPPGGAGAGGPPHPPPPASSSQKTASSRSSQPSKRGNANAARNKAQDSAGAGAAKGSSQRRNQDKQSASATKASAAAAKAEAAAAAKADAAGNADEPVQESKKIRKRKEVVDRIHRVHWEAHDNRDILFNEMQHALASTGSVLLLSPALSRPYLLALNRLTLERDAQLRQTALLHAHQVESARAAYEQDREGVDKEAEKAKRAIREQLLAAVDERRRRLREDKEGGEGTSDALLDTSTRSHATRKLRNKGPGASRRDGGLEPGAGLSIAARAKITPSTNGANGSSLGLSLGASSDAEGAATPEAGGAAGGSANGADSLGNPLLGSLLELSGIGAANGHIAALPPSNFDQLTSGAAAASLLHLGVGGGMGDSSYMSGFRASLQTHSKGKKKTSSSKTATAAASSANAAANAISSGLGGGADGMGGDDEDDENSQRSRAAAAAAAVAAATMLNGAGRLRWDQGKSVGQLTSAKDIEIESDLISIRKVGNKRRRR